MKYLRIVGVIVLIIVFYGGLGLLNTANANGLGFCASAMAKVLPGC